MTYRRLVKLVDGRGGIKDPLQRVDQLRDDDVALHLGPAGGGGAKGPDDRGEHRRLGRWQIHEEPEENGRSQTAKNDHGTGGKGIIALSTRLRVRPPNTVAAENLPATLTTLHDVLRMARTTDMVGIACALCRARGRRRGFE